jgi:hypothetical protein
MARADLAVQVLELRSHYLGVHATPFRSADPPFHEPEPAIASEGWSSSQGL